MRWNSLKKERGTGWRKTEYLLNLSVSNLIPRFLVEADSSPHDNQLYTFIIPCGNNIIVDHLFDTHFFVPHLLIIL